MASAGNKISRMQCVHTPALPIMPPTSGTADHFLRCTHPTRQQLWEELTDQIQWLSIKKQLHHMIQEHLIQGIRSITTNNTPPPTDMNHNSTHCSQQQQIGWKQIIYG